jgi:hypothetical protein
MKKKKMKIIVKFYKIENNVARKISKREFFKLLNIYGTEILQTLVAKTDNILHIILTLNLDVALLITHFGDRE